MFDYLQKFNSLPQDLRDRVSSASAMLAIADLESQYRVDLAMTVMKVMIKSIAVKDLPVYFMSDLGLAREAAESLTADLKAKVLFAAADYLGLSSAKRAFDLDKDIEVLLKEAGLSLASANLISRFKNIIATYFRGIRSKIDTRNSLAKDAKIGGLNLSPVEIDRVFRACDHLRSHGLTASAPAPSAPTGSAVPAAAPLKVATAPARPTTPVHPVMPAHPVVPPHPVAPAEYDLKQALSRGEVKRPETTKPLAQPEIKAPAAPLDLPLAVPEEALPAPAKQVQSKTPEQVAISKSVPSKSAELKPAPKPSPVAPSAIHSASPAIHPVTVRANSSLSPLKPPVKSVTPPIVQAPSRLTKVGFWSRLFKGRKPADASKIAKEKAPLKTAPSKPAPILKSAPTSKPTPAPVLPVKVVPPKATPVATPVSPIVSANRPAPASANRPQLHDIKPMPKIMGPVEELQFFDLVNFRRLSPDPNATTAKIFAKIKLLEGDGYDKMVAGVKAWRQSPVNRLYLRLGQEAVAKGLSLRDAIDARQKANQDYLSLEEIKAILNLNNKLIF